MAFLTIAPSVRKGANTFGALKATTCETPQRAKGSPDGIPEPSKEMPGTLGQFLLGRAWLVFPLNLRGTCGLSEV